MNDFLNKISPQTLYATMVATVVIMCLAAYLYGFKKPIQEYRILKSSSQLLEAKVKSDSNISDKLMVVREEIETLRKNLQGQSPILSTSKLVAYVINGLDTISAKHTVKFLGMTPATPVMVKYFEELPFAIEVSGNYFSLYDWLQQVERELGPMVVKKISMEPTRGTEEQIMRLDMVSYRLN